MTPTLNILTPAFCILLWFLLGYLLSKSYYKKLGFRGTYIPRRHMEVDYIHCWCIDGSASHEEAKKLQTLYGFTNIGKPALIFWGIIFWPYPAMGLLIEKVRLAAKPKKPTAREIETIIPTPRGLFDPENK